MDVRALLAAEKASRRISHPHLTYEKSGRLVCNVCNLQIRSESLWDGHTKSANHRKNVLAQHDGNTKSLKRKIDDVETPVKREEPVEDVRKKARASSVESAEDLQNIENGAQRMAHTNAQSADTLQEPPAEELVSKDPEMSTPTQATPAINEDEWAAFERDIATLEKPDYSSATITAAPLSAAELAASAESEKKRRREDEAEDEKEDEGRRIEEEFEVMEEFEERVKRLREKREAIRVTESAQIDAGQKAPMMQRNPDSEGEDDEEDVDDWYR